MRIHDFIYYLNNLGFFLWVEGDSLKYSLNKKIEDIKKREILNQIILRKNELIAFLSANKIFSRDYLNENYIYKIFEKSEELSYQQQSIYYINKLYDNNNFLNIPITFELEFNTNLECLKNSIMKLIKNNEILRTNFIEQENFKILQILDNKFNLGDFINCIKVNDERDLEKEIETLTKNKFDLANEFPIKFLILNLDNKLNINKKYLSMVIHHIAIDGWSIDLLIREISKIYIMQSERCKNNLKLDYKDYSCWQKNYAKTDKCQEKAKYFASKLAGYQKIVISHISDSNDKLLNNSGDYINFEVNSETSSFIKEYAAEKSISITSLLLTAYLISLKLYSNQNDITIAIPFPNRGNIQTQNILGYFVNLLPLRVKFLQKQTIEQLIIYVFDSLVELQSMQDIPLNLILNELALNKDDKSFLNVSFETLDYGYSAKKFESPFTKILEEYKENYHKTSRFDLSIFVKSGEDKITGQFIYKTSLFTNESIINFKNLFLSILENLRENTNKCLFDIDFVKLSGLSTSIESSEYKISPNKQLLIHHFREFLNKSPESIAITYKNKNITYAELNSKSNIVAHSLKSIGIKAGAIIPVLLDKSDKYFFAILALLKIRACFVPIDPKTTDERINKIIDDINPPIVITSPTHSDKIYNNFCYVYDIYEELSKNYHLNLSCEDYFVNDTSPGELAYIIYTSGSTGSPKGVMITHLSLANYAMSVIKELELNSNETFDFSSSVSFDLSITNSLVPLFLGARISVYDKKLENNSDYTEYINKNQISIIKHIPSYIATLDLKANCYLKYIILGGEKIYDDFNKKFTQIKNLELVIDEYGPTETSVGVYYNIIYKKNFKTIDKAIAYNNISLYILDNSLNSTLDGTIGELYVEGISLARGYFNSPRLTSEKFISSPYTYSSRMYKTGDLVRYKDGNIEFLGRNDSQIKINGYRIELGEIESNLLSYKHINRCCVIKKEINNSIKIIAFYTSEKQLDDSSLRNYLTARIPYYMMPLKIIYLDRFPTLSNGKIDKSKLENIELPSNAKKINPKSKNEKSLQKLWAEFFDLKISEISIEDDFFELGGSSIDAIKLVGLINQKLDFEINVYDVLERRTISNISKLFDDSDNTSNKYKRFILKANEYVSE